MPYQRATLTQLQNQAAQDINSNLTGADALLRFNNVGVLGKVLAGMVHMLYGYVDWTAKQSNPATAEDEFLAGWAALKNVTRKATTQASGAATFAATGSQTISAGSVVTRSDGYKFTVRADAAGAGGSVTVSLQAQADPDGLLGAGGNGVAGITYTLANAVSGITSTSSSSTAFTGGADIETEDDFRARMLLAYQDPPQGGDQEDYVEWALDVSGVTRAWCVPNFMGSGTVGVYVMFDDANSAYDGFPQGTNGVSADDLGPGGTPRDTVATGDQLTVADAIWAKQPVTALVYAMAPTAAAQNFVISGLASASTATKTAVNEALANVLLEYGSVGAGETTVNLSEVEVAVAAVANSSGFVITSPTGDIVVPAGAIPTLGTVTFP
jgi:uncharacterized phage protein gp47/JayE